ncbi:MAG: SH3 domain-containing protein [Alphaproteobacteria bacterium]|nr:SH3 domain-containing protein [Alphaproteobacteria bacterium]
MTPLLALSAAALAAPGYVHADLANLREAPAQDAARVARVRVNTAVQVLQIDSAGWAEVALLDRPAEHPVQGWIRADLVGANPHTVPGLRREIADAWDAGQPEAALRAAERVVALDGRDPADWRRLRALYREVDDDLGVERATGWLDHTDTVHVAVCRAGRAELTASVRADGQLLPMVHEGQERDGLLEVLSQADAMTWYAHPSDGRTATPVQGSPFATPYLAEVWNDGPRTPWGSEGCSGACSSERIVVLGPCDDEGAVLATRPLSAHLVQAVPEPQAELLLDQAARSSVPGELSGPVTRLGDDLMMIYATESGDSWPGGPAWSDTRPLFVDAAGAPVRWQGTAGPWGMSVASEALWFDLMLPEGPALLGVMRSQFEEPEGNAGEGVDLWLFREDEPADIAEVLLSGSGC